MSRFYEIFTNNVETLDSVFEIGDILEYIKELNNKNDYYINLKKYRASVLDEKIKANEEKVEKLREVILNTMKKYSPDEKTIDFSPVGKVNRRVGPSKWEVEDEEKLIKFLEKEGKKDSVVEIKEKIVKKNLNQALSSFTKKKVPGAVFLPGEETISISYGDKTTISEKVKEDVNYDKMDELNVEELTI